MKFEYVALNEFNAVSYKKNTPPSQSIPLPSQSGVRLDAPAAFRAPFSTQYCYTNAIKFVIQVP